MKYNQKYIEQLTKTLTKKEIREINKQADKELVKFKEAYISNGDTLPNEDIEAISRSLRSALKEIRIINKLKYTPKKYRTNNKLFEQKII